MSGRRRLGAALAVAAALACAFPLAASASGLRTAVLAKRGIAHAVARGWVKPPDARRYRGDVYRAQLGIRALPKLRGYVLESQLAQVSAIWDSYIAPRATALFAQLRENVDYLRTHRIPDGPVDVRGEDGVVYRWFPGKGLEFHPLANFSKLNALAVQGDADGARQLADALLARAIPRRGALLWEYAFPYGPGRPPWTSGLAQAVAAQALSRTARLLGDQPLAGAAARAYAAIPRDLSLGLSTGPWVRLYSFDREIVLNAQLQAIVSLREYAAFAADASVAGYADRLLAAARGLFPRFDTGDWSRYELGGGYAKRNYQEFVTTLLKKVAKQTQDPFWQDAAARFVNYTYEPPLVTQPQPPPALTAFPQPLDGWLDSVGIPVTLSKRASVTLVVAGDVLTWRNLSRGDHVLTWTPASDVQPGTYPATLRATDFTGRHAAYSLAPVTVAWDTAPPPLSSDTVHVDPATNVLTWTAAEPGTPWLQLRLELTDPEGVRPPQTLELGRQPTSGSLQLAVPEGTWAAALDAVNSAGLATRVELPPLTGTAPAPPAPPPPSP